jgi:phage/plasmid primase-like uncharacterized protein
MTSSTDVVSNGDVVEEFRVSMLAHGLETPDPIIPNLKLRRIHIIGDKPRSKNGWYVLYTDGHPAGAFGTKKGDLRVKWSSKQKAEPMTREERERRREEIRRRQVERASAQAMAHELAAEHANRLWDAAADCETHAYLEAKQVPAIGLKVGRFERIDQETGQVILVSNRALLIPIRNPAREIVSLQAIYTDPRHIHGFQKAFLVNGEKKGKFFAIGKPTDNIVLICEGLATGLSLHAATGYGVLVAFDAGNLMPVAKEARRCLPDSRIVIAADNDAWTDMPIKNPGVHYATLAAQAVLGKVVVPDFKNANSKPTDFNDLYKLEGVEAVNKIIAAALPKTISERSNVTRDSADSNNSSDRAKPETNQTAAEVPSPQDDVSGCTNLSAAWPSPLDILTQLAAAPFSDLDVPPCIGEYPMLYAQSSGIDQSILLSAAVSAACAAITGEFKICADADTWWLQQALLWFLTIAQPGAGKTPGQREMTAPLHSLHADLLATYEKDLAEYERLKNDPETTSDIGPPPIRPRVVLSNTTLEALSEVLRDNPRGIFILAEEFDSWLGSLDQYRSGDIGSDRGHWLSAFDGGPHYIERIKRGSSFVPNWAASILTATTPAALKRLSKHLPIDGLMQRFILVLANRIQQDPIARPSRDVIDSARQRYVELIHRLWNLKPRAHKGVVQLSNEAAAGFAEWRRENAKLQEALGSIEPAIEAHLAKYPNMLLRIALVFHIATIASCDDGRPHDPAAFPVSGETMRLAQCFLKRAREHAMVVYLSREGGTEAYELARCIARLILSRPEEVNARGIAVRDLVQKVHAFRRAEERVQAASLRLLVDVGWLRENDTGYRKASPARYAINPDVGRLFAVIATQERERRALARDQLAAAVAQRREQNKQDAAS